MISKQVINSLHHIHSTFQTTFYFVGALTGFANLGEINNHLLAYESQLAEDRAERGELAHSMLVIMVRGFFSRLEFPYAQFPCTDLSRLLAVNNVCGVLYYITVKMHHFNR